MNLSEKIDEVKRQRRAKRIAEADAARAVIFEIKGGGYEAAIREFRRKRPELDFSAAVIEMANTLLANL